MFFKNCFNKYKFVFIHQHFKFFSFHSLSENEMHLKTKVLLTSKIQNLHASENTSQNNKKKNCKWQYFKKFIFYFQV